MLAIQVVTWLTVAFLLTLLRVWFSIWPEERFPWSGPIAMTGALIGGFVGLAFARNPHAFSGLAVVLSGVGAGLALAIEWATRRNRLI